MVGALYVAPSAVLGASHVKLEAPIAIEVLADGLVPFGEELQLILHATFLHSAVVTLTVVEIEVGYAAITSRVDGEACCHIGVAPELCGVVVSVLALACQWCLSHTASGGGHQGHGGKNGFIRHSCVGRWWLIL